MGLIKEPLEVNFVVDRRPLTKAEENALSEFIKADKKKGQSKDLRKKSTKKSKSKNPA